MEEASQQSQYGSLHAYLIKTLNALLQEAVYGNKKLHGTLNDGNCIIAYAISPPNKDISSKVVFTLFSEPALENYIYNITLLRNTLRRDTYAVAASVMCRDAPQASEDAVKYDAAVIINNDDAVEALRDITNYDNVVNVIKSDMKQFEKKLTVTIVAKKRNLYHAVAFAAIPLLAKLLMAPPPSRHLPWGRLNLIIIFLSAAVSIVYLNTHPSAGFNAILLLLLVVASIAWPWLRGFLKS